MVFKKSALAFGMLTASCVLSLHAVAGPPEAYVLPVSSSLVQDLEAELKRHPEPYSPESKKEVSLILSKHRFSKEDIRVFYQRWQEAKRLYEDGTHEGLASVVDPTDDGGFQGNAAGKLARLRLRPLWAFIFFRDVKLSAVDDLGFLSTGQCSFLVEGRNGPGNVVGVENIIKQDGKTVVIRRNHAEWPRERTDQWIQSLAQKVGRDTEVGVNIRHLRQTPAAYDNHPFFFSSRVEGKHTDSGETNLIYYNTPDQNIESLTRGGLEGDSGTYPFLRRMRTLFQGKGTTPWNHYETLKWGIEYVNSMQHSDSAWTQSARSMVLAKLTTYAIEAMSRDMSAEYIPTRQKFLHLIESVLLMTQGSRARPYLTSKDFQDTFRSLLDFDRKLREEEQAERAKSDARYSDSRNKLLRGLRDLVGTSVEKAWRLRRQDCQEVLRDLIDPLRASPEEALRSRNYGVVLIRTHDLQSPELNLMLTKFISDPSQGLPSIDKPLSERAKLEADLFGAISANSVSHLLEHNVEVPLDVLREQTTALLRNARVPDADEMPKPALETKSVNPSPDEIYGALALASKFGLLKGPDHETVQLLDAMTDVIRSSQTYQGWRGPPFETTHGNQTPNAGESAKTGDKATLYGIDDAPSPENEFLIPELAWHAIANQWSALDSAIQERVLNVVAEQLKNPDMRDSCLEFVRDTRAVNAHVSDQLYRILVNKTIKGAGPQGSSHLRNLALEALEAAAGNPKNSEAAFTSEQFPRVIEELTVRNKEPLANLIRKKSPRFFDLALPHIHARSCALKKTVDEISGRSNPEKPQP
jgi:hypothetical protein